MAILKLKNKTTGEWEEIQAIKGNGISSIEKTSTSGLVDTYTITYTNGNTTTFDVSNGNGISSIEKTATVGNKDTYTIYFTNGETTMYEVSNGEVTREELQEEVDRLSMIYNAFPSTTGEGEEASINGTAEVPFKEIGLKGNTSQDGEPTPDTPIPVNVVTGDNSITISNNDNTQSQTYPINLGSMELCKIGNYQDVIKRSSGKNLFDKSITPENFSSNSSGEKVSDSDLCINQELNNVDFSNIYVSFSSIAGSAYVRVCEYNSSGIFIKRTLVNANQSLTLDSNTKKLIFSVNASSTKYFANLMINLGTTALPYEPYGKVWYKYGAIGKHTITDTDIKSISSYWYSSYGQYGATIDKAKFGISGISDRASLCNKAIKINALANISENKYMFNANAGAICFFSSKYDTIAHANEELVGANVYFNLDTPTYEEITDTTLIEQLDNLEKAYSYDTQTNISQTNQDKPFIISYEAILSLRNVLNKPEDEEQTEPTEENNAPIEE